jgi:hypothetical protein
MNITLLQRELPQPASFILDATSIVSNDTFKLKVELNLVITVLSTKVRAYFTDLLMFLYFSLYH